MSMVSFTTGIAAVFMSLMSRKQGKGLRIFYISSRAAFNF